ncbi:glycosyl hydrolase [Frondihabitans australicus]|uniref:Alpha-L-rhamnosidase-like protein n=1 Tax=Frondihabitans australicus TaxID=386892 RepID=A0A495IIX7_9MICO|nr:glycosyl hydrolase [Frondihabitans australicus]RKR75972.1 alpha-L-rhamnosidase-like protein [Frondihabitans australicus]
MALADIRRDFQDPPIEFRPEVRWWLAEGLHTDATLRDEIDTAHRLGFGGMEFLAMDEQAIDHSRYGWGAEEWVHDSQIVVEETTKRDMAVSFTSGTNWSNANLPNITPDHVASAKELDVLVEDLAAGAGRTGALPQVDLAAPPPAESMLPGERGEIHDQHFVAAIAARVVAERDGHTPGVLSVDSVVDLTDQVQGAGSAEPTLDFTAPDDGDWKLFVFWSHGTGQTASPSAGINYTVTYLDPEGAQAVIDYWDTVILTPELRAEIAKNPRAQMYMDSLELSVYGAGGLFWGHTVAAEFESRRGYSILPWLPFLTRTVPMMASTTRYHWDAEAADAITIDKVRFDYVKTLTDLYIENMLRPFGKFLRESGMTLRSEISYGLPFELTRPGPEVDGIENESLEFGSQIDAYRLLAGPAHLFGKQYSSETGATTRNHILNHRFYDQIIATQLAAGITKTVLHGWASTAGAEGVTTWPGHEGMWGMFSERFDTRQPASEFYPEWTAAVGRVQYLLRRGLPRIDVGILRTDHFTDNTSGMTFRGPDGKRWPDEVAYGTWWMRNRENFWWEDLGMQDAGWTYEFFDGSLLRRDDVSFDGTLVQPGGPGYQALIVYQSTLEVDDAAHLLDWAKQGLKVVFVHGARELACLAAGTYTTHEKAGSRTPGLDGRDDELAQVVAELLQQPSVVAVDSPAASLQALRDLGVVGRAEFTADNTTVLSHLRHDGDLTHLYLYNFLYDNGSPTAVEVSLPGHGTPWRLDPWSGALRPVAGSRSVSTPEGGDRTLITVELDPGEIALVTLDRSAAPAADSSLPLRRDLATLDDWTIAVESWDAGELQVITEDRGLGYVTTEVKPLTAVTPLAAATRTLAPWTELAEVGPDVSGVGSYETVFTVEALPAGGDRILLDLGSTSGGLGAVQVNGSEPVGFDTSHPVVDVTSLVRSGSNELTVRVSSSLNNRLLARGYYDELHDIGAEFLGIDQTQQTSPQPYGLVGPVRLVHESH